MKSMADEMRRELTDEVKAMSVDERFALVDRLAEDNVAVPQAAIGRSPTPSRHCLASFVVQFRTTEIGVLSFRWACVLTRKRCPSFATS